MVGVQTNVHMSHPCIKLKMSVLIGDRIMCCTAVLGRAAMRSQTLELPAVQRKAVSAKLLS